MLIARTMDAEAAAYQAGHSKVSMTRKHYVEEYEEAMDTRAVLLVFEPSEHGTARGANEADPAES